MPGLKICGINDAGIAAKAATLGADCLGFVFAEGSPRRVSPGEAGAIALAVAAALRDAPGAPRRPPRFAGVFTGGTAEEIGRVAASVPLDIVQLHGDFPAATVRALKRAGFEVWRLAPAQADGTDDLGEDAVLLDGRDGARTGGTGRRADWSRVAELKKQGRKVVLAGGLCAANIADAAATGADVLDVNSGVETAPGVKSPALLEELFRRV